MRQIPLAHDRSASFLVLACWAAVAVLGTAAPARGQAPGPESFAQEPKTPLEFWNVADYLVRSGQPAQAVPYLNRFLKSEPKDADLLAIRDRYGVGSILRLDDDPATRPLARPINGLLAAAVRRNATRADRIERFVGQLTQTAEEQDYAVERLVESGPYAIPFLVEALDRPGLSRGDRALIVRNLSRLDRSTVPPLIAALDSSDPRLVADAAEILGRLGDPRAIPALTALAASTPPTAPGGIAARNAIRLLTGRTFESQPRSPVRLLTDEAWRYHRHAIQFPGDPVLLWSWDEARKVPAPRLVRRTDVEAELGLRMARAALRLEPGDVPAQVALTSLALEKAVERSGFPAFLGGDPSGATAAALAAGPGVLGLVLQTAIADGKMDLAAAAATALGQVTDRDALVHGHQRVHPLIATLSAPSRRAQFAAARALVRLEPRRAFAGSSRVVPVLARFVTSQAAPKAVVIDGNVPRGNLIAGSLRGLGYDTTLAATGDDGFRAAAESADVELVLIDPHFVQGDWRLVDTLSNLRSDARTAGIPAYVYGPLGMEVDLRATLTNFPGVRFLVTPTTPDSLEKQLGGRPVSLSDAERGVYAREAAGLLALIAATPGSPFESDLAAVEPSLAIALNTPATAPAASAAMGDVPVADAQRGLADILLDPSKPTPLRLVAAIQLARSLRRFGPLVAADQEAGLAASLDRERDPSLRAALAAVYGALRPKAAPAGARLRQAEVLAPSPPPIPTPPSTSPNPGSVPSPPTPENPPPADGGAAEAMPPDAVKP